MAAMSNTMLSPEITTSQSLRQSTNEHLAYFTGSVLTYEESGTSSRRTHSHNGYSSGFSPSRSQWREHETQVRTERVD
jgi:hypothetical protein